MTTKTEPIVVEQTYDASVQAVWKAITDKDQMRQWYFEAIADFKAEVGFETRFVVHHEGRDYPHVWNVTEVVPEKRIAYGWRYDGMPGNASVVWDLAETTGGTKLTFTQTGLDTFPDDPAFTRESCEAGWDYFLRQRLKEHLE